MTIPSNIPTRRPMTLLVRAALAITPVVWGSHARADAPRPLDHASTARLIVELRDSDELCRMPAEPEVLLATRTPLAPERAVALQSKKAELVAALQTGPRVRVVDWLRPFRFIILASAAEDSEGLAQRLVAMPSVARVFPDQRLDEQLDESLPYVQAGAFQSSHAAGAGTAVAVLDTPVRLGHEAFGSCPAPGAPGCRVRLQLNFTDTPITNVIQREDQLGIGSHGTNVAAVVLGVAPETNILSLNVFHDDPFAGVVANLSDTLAAMAWVAENAAAHGIVAVNTSLGTFRTNAAACNDSASFDPIRTLHRDHGVLTVTVAGNDSQSNAVRDPGCVSSAVTVGALFDHDDAWYSDATCQQEKPRVGQLACFSNLNGLVDIIAPGVGVSAGGYVMTGTSQAAPHVAGAIAAWQSFHLQRDGAFRTAAWMQRNLLASSSSPLVHRDARSFSQLRMGEGVTWDYAHAFGWWYEELPQNAIPYSGPPLEEVLSVSGQDWDVAGAYLYLEVTHPQPEHVEITLTSPSGQASTLSLPFGQANFTGLVGRTVFPGAFASLAGSPANGTWALTVRDTAGLHQGNYLQGALYLVREGCAPRCDGSGCGDDGCGGQCGEICIIDGVCRLEWERAEGEPCMACRPSADHAGWTALTGATCDDGDPCTTGDQCMAGRCEGVRDFGCGGGGPADQVPEAPEQEAKGDAAESGGCGCTAAGRGGGPFALLAVLIGVVLRRLCSTAVKRVARHQNQS